VFKGNSNFISPFARNLFFLAIRCSKELASKVSPNSKVPRISTEFVIKFHPYKILWILIPYPFKIGRGFYGGSWLSFRELQNYILFQIF
jgi:hypothetical protein